MAEQQTVAIVQIAQQSRRALVPVLRLLGHALQE